MKALARADRGISVPAQEVFQVRRFICVLVLVVLAGTATAPALAGARNFGVQGGYSGDLDWFIGLRGELETSKLFKNSRSAIDVNYFFPGGNLKVVDANLNYLWPLKTLMEDTDTNLYVGAGLNVAYGWVSDVDDSSNWTAGLNVLGGFNYDLGDRAWFLEFGYTFFSDYDQWRVGTGFLF